MTINQNALDFQVERLFGDLSAGYGGVMVSIGAKLGLYKAMAGAGPLSSAELAKRADCAERYVREWLNSQVAGGYIDYHGTTGAYELTREQEATLADDESPFYFPHAWQVVASMWADEPKAIEAIKTGKGIAWGDHDGRLFCGSAAFFRNGYAANLVQNWIPALDGVEEKLTKGARVADFGCGHGHSTVLMAEAYPNSQFHGFDAHAGSIDEARKAAEDSDVTDRATFHLGDAAVSKGESFDLVCFFDSLHDMGRPVDVVEAAKRLLNADGSIMIVEPAAGDRVEDNINPVGRLFYSASTTICCAHAISENGTHVLGAQAGNRRLSEVLKDAGFSSVREVSRTPFNVILQAQR